MVEPELGPPARVSQTVQQKAGPVYAEIAHQEEHRQQIGDRVQTPDTNSAEGQEPGEEQSLGLRT